MRNLFLLLCFLSSVLLVAQDKEKASKGAITITPIMHGSLVLQWDGLDIFIDPYGGSSLYERFKPDLVLITDIHGDHYHPKTLEALDLTKASLVAPEAVADLMNDHLKGQTNILGNGGTTQISGVTIIALPMYNLPETSDSRHPKGRGNGYVIELGGKRIYISGDTEDIPEMRALKDIDIAFVCMNLPYTMDVDQAADAVAEFKPKVVYPFHYRGGGGTFSDVQKFKSLVESTDKNIEVRLRDWYGE